jgi:hypothetical protein
VSGFTLFSNHVLKSTFCDAHHILKTAVALDSAASIRFIGSREIAMTLTEFFVRADATPLERRGRSVWRLFLDRIVEGRMRKAEREIVEYFQRHGREMPPKSAALRAHRQLGFRDLAGKSQARNASL